MEHWLIALLTFLNFATLFLNMRLWRKRREFASGPEMPAYSRTAAAILAANEARMYEAQKAARVSR